jgi:hypothetical protein
MYSVMCRGCRRLLGRDGHPLEFRGGVINSWEYISRIAFRVTKREIAAVAREKGWKTERREFLCSTCVQRRLCILRKPNRIEEKDSCDVNAGDENREMSHQV